MEDRREKIEDWESFSFMQPTNQPTSQPTTLQLLVVVKHDTLLSHRTFKLVYWILAFEANFSMQYQRAIWVWGRANKKPPPPPAWNDIKETVQVSLVFSDWRQALTLLPLLQLLSLSLSLLPFDQQLLKVASLVSSQIVKIKSLFGSFLPSLSKALSKSTISILALKPKPKPKPK